MAAAVFDSAAGDGPYGPPPLTAQYGKMADQNSLEAIKGLTELEKNASIIIAGSAMSGGGPTGGPTAGGPTGPSSAVGSGGIGSKLAPIKGPKPGAPTSIVGRPAANLAEQLTMQEAQAGAGQVVMQGPFGDPLYQGAGWVKMQVVHTLPDGTKIVVHYMKNIVTGVVSQFKFK